MRILLTGPSLLRAYAARLSLPDHEWPTEMAGVPVPLLAESLLRLGHQVHVVTASPGLKESWHREAQNFALTVVPYRARPRDRALDLFKHEREHVAAVIAETEADVIHAHWTYEFAGGAIQAGRSTPLLVTAHDSPFTVFRHMPDPYRFFRLLTAISVRRQLPTLSAVSPYLADKWRKHMMYKNQIPVVPNISPFELADERRQPALRGSFNILEIANDSPLKNVSSLISAFAYVIRRFPEARLRLIGPGLDSEGQLATRARSAGLHNGVDFLGQCDREQVLAELDSAAIFAHASLEESQPMCLLEAMSRSVPVVAGRYSGGTKWSLDDGSAGTLTDVTNPPVFAQAIIDTLVRPEERERVAQRGRELIVTRYAGEAVARKYLDLYETIS